MDPGGVLGFAPEGEARQRAAVHPAERGSSGQQQRQVVEQATADRAPKIHPPERQ
jgi:hypothetical protein